MNSPGASGGHALAIDFRSSAAYAVRGVALCWGLLLLFGFPQRASAQSPSNIDWGGLETAIATDGSLLGVPKTPVAPAEGDPHLYEISDALGQRLGSNLFHSFESFDLSGEDTARFIGAAASNVISRITGGAASRIDGKIESRISAADGSDATLYLLNSSGILFGPSGEFDTASVALATADRLRFDAGIFATSPQSPDTPGIECCAGEPIAFEFDGASSARIDFDGRAEGQKALYRWEDGGSLQIVASEIRVEGTDLQTEGGTLYFSAVGSNAGSIPLGLSGDFLAPPVQPEAGAIEVSDGSLLSTLATGNSNGRVVLRAGQLVFEDSSGIEAGGDGQGVAIDLVASQSIRIWNRSRLVDEGAPTSDFGGAEGIRLEAPRIEIAKQSWLASGSQASTWAGPIRILAQESFHLGSAEVIRDRSYIRSRTSADRPGGEILIEAGFLSLASGASIQSEASRFATARAPGIRVEAETISMRGESMISSVSKASSPGGDLHLIASSALELVDGSVLKTRPDGSGDAGSIEVDAGSLSLVDGSQISSETDGEGAPGDIALRVEGQLLVSGVKEYDPGVVAQAGILARTLDLAPAGVEGGDIEIDAGSLEVSEGGLISVRGFGLASAGNIDIDVISSLRVSGESGGEASRSSEISARGVRGGSGDIVLKAEEVEVLAGAAVSATTTDSGNAGDVEITADLLRVSGHSIPRGSVDPQPSGIYAESTSPIADALAEVGGAAGSLILHLQEGLEVSDSGKLSVRTHGGGAAGVLEVTVARGSIAIFNDGLLLSESLSRAGGAGAAGNILLSAAGNLAVRSGGRLEATTANVDAGDIRLDAGGSVSLVDALVSTNSDLKLGGNIHLDAVEKVEVIRSAIETNVGGAGDGGNIWIGQGRVDPPEPPRYAVLADGRVTATAEAGRGGFIEIAADHYLKSVGSRVDASSELGEDGEVEVAAPEVRVGGNIVPLEVAYLDLDRLLARPCAARSQSDRSSLTVGGRPGIPADPEGMLPSPILMVADELPEASRAARERLASGLGVAAPRPHAAAFNQGPGVGFLPGFHPRSTCSTGLR